MEPVASNIQVLLQAAEFLERRERGEGEPLASPGAGDFADTGLGGTRVAAGRIHGFRVSSPGAPLSSAPEASAAGRAGGELSWRQKLLVGRPA